jgi:hypothetical protein
MTGSISASGKIPFLPAHSISNDKMRSGATFDQSPTASCETSAEWLEGSKVSGKKWERGDGRTYSHSTSYWQFDVLLSLCDQVPAFSSSQFIPTICERRSMGGEGGGKNERKATRKGQSRPTEQPDDEKYETYVMVNHEPQRVSDVTLESHQRRPIEVFLVVDLAPLERVTHLRVLLRIDDGKFDERRNGVALVAPEGALVGDGNGLDGTGTVEMGGLSEAREARKGQRIGNGKREGGAYVEVLEKGKTVAVAESTRCGNPEVGEETLDVQENRVSGL